MLGTIIGGPPPTTLEHLVAEHEARVTVVDDAHVAEFLALTGPEAAYLEQPEGTDRSELFELHRRRSIHVHCWTEDEFPEVLRYCVTKLAHNWELIERYPLAQYDIERYPLAQYDIELAYAFCKIRPLFWRRRDPTFDVGCAASNGAVTVHPRRRHGRHDASPPQRPGRHRHIGWTPQ